MDKDLIEYEANFSVLDRYGTEVTKEEFITDPAIGRDQQIKDLILVLLTPEKSAILIGKPGIGKTAIVEGLAYRIQKNDVPEALQGYTIINIKTASLLGTLPSGESKVQKMIDELKTKDRMILFIDEIHMLIGSTETSSVDFANIFKEGLGRGSIKVIGATTTEEYEKYILRDKAFTRRFQKIEVPEPTREETIKIMMGTLPKFEKQTGRKMKYTSFIQERIMSFIVDITSEYKRIYSLGSRYPDVCLTLLKQAFSYTVYDNRPYMDIFDVRKAIENSKNIYPDVIKKELPNFDNLFNDIILEEKGEKPVEEWRKDGTLSRKELEDQSDEEQDGSTGKDLSTIADVPEFVDRLELRDSKPVNNIISSRGKAKYAKVGSTAVSTGIKEKINKTSNSKALDDLLLSSDMNVLKAQEPSGRVITNYVVTEEIMPGVDDNYLLQRPIMSNIEQDVQLQEEDAYRYRGNQRRRNEGKRMWNNDYRPERQDISSQNFDKYQNFFHPENNVNNQENEKRMDLLMGRNNNNYNQGPMPNNGYDPMMNQMPGPMPGPMAGPMGPMPNNGMYNPMMNQMPGPMAGPMGPMPNNGYDPMMNQMPPVQGPMQQPMYNQDNMNNGFLNMQDNGQNQDLQNDNAFFGTPKPELTTVSDKETLFGAPMYSDNKPSPELSLDTTPDLPDINGNILADNMSLKNGEIVNEFPTFEKLNNLSNITSFQTDDNQDNNSGNINMMNPQPMPNNFGMMNPQPMPNNFGMMNPQPMPNNFGMMNQQPMPNNYGMMNQQQMPMNNNRNWTFINGQQNNPQPTTNNVSSFFQKNILDEAKKKQNNSESNTNNITSPTNNKDYYEDMKSGEFVNFSDLNSGKVKEEDTNKYMGVQTEENKPQFDLNLESNIEEDNKFDDFYE